MDNLEQELYEIKKDIYHLLYILNFNNFNKNDENGNELKFILSNEILTRTINKFEKLELNNVG